MSDLGIGIKVDASQVRDAKKDIFSVSKALEELEKHSKLQLEIDGGTELNEILHSMTGTLKDMQGLAGKGSRQGGKFDSAQRKEWVRLEEKQKSNADAYEKVLSKIGQQLDSLYEKRKKLEKIPITSPREWTAAQDQLKQVNDDLKAGTAAYERLQQKYDPRYNRVLSRSGNIGQDVGGYGDMGEGGGGGNFAIGPTLRAIGATWLFYKLMQTEREGWKKYEQQAVLESGLTVRGFDYQRRKSPWNYSPALEAEGAMGLLRTTGASDMGTLDRLERFSRLTNMDLGQATGVLGGYYQATGANPQKQQQAIDALLYMGKQAKDGRIETLLGVINANLMIAQRAQGGKALTDAQAQSIMAQTTAFYNSGGTMGFTSNMFQSMQNALLPGGDPTGELMKWNILGGFDGPMTPAKMLEMQRRRSSGLNDRSNLQRAMQQARLMSNSREGRILALQMMFPEQMGVNTQSGWSMASALYDNYGTFMKASTTGDYQALISNLSAAYKGADSYNTQQRMTDRAIKEINVGEGTEPAHDWLGRAWNKTLDIGGKLFKGGWSDVPARQQQYETLLNAAADRAGVDRAWFKSMVWAESEFKPRLTSKKGAKGLAQLMPGTFAAMSKKYGLKNDINDPAANLQAGAYYLSDMLRMSGGNYDMATRKYNAGPSGNLHNSETDAYLDKIHGYYPAESAGRTATPGQPVAVYDPSAISLLQEIRDGIRTIGGATRR
jgi:soluble lytic murein transglycosylase-like protein